MILFRKKESKDLDSWINKSIRINLHEDGFYEGTLLQEQNNGLLIEGANKKRIYIQFDSIVSLEEL